MVLGMDICPPSRCFELRTCRFLATPEGIRLCPAMAIEEKRSHVWGTMGTQGGRKLSALCETAATRKHCFSYVHAFISCVSLAVTKHKTQIHKGHDHQVPSKVHIWHLKVIAVGIY